MSGALGYIPHMARLETPAARIDRLLESGDAVGALLAADQFLAKAPNSFLGRLGRCRANIRLSNADALYVSMIGSDHNLKAAIQ